MVTIKFYKTLTDLRVAVDKRAWKNDRTESKRPTSS